MSDIFNEHNGSISLWDFITNVCESVRDFADIIPSPHGVAYRHPHWTAAPGESLRVRGQKGPRGLVGAPFASGGAAHLITVVRCFSSVYIIIVSLCLCDCGRVSL